jgi:glycosyltransferase involved in cell wall biosynthesis
MKKVLWLSHFIPFPPKGGNLQRSYNLIRELSKVHDLTLLSFNQSNIIGTPELLQIAKEHFSEFCIVADVIDIPSENSTVRRFFLLLKSLLPLRTYTVSWLESKEFARKLDQLISDNHFDIIHVDTISLAPYVSHLQDIKIVLNHHNIESAMMLRRAENESNLFRKLYFYQEGIKLQKLEREICNKFALNITCSDLDSERLKSAASVTDCISIPNGVDLDYFQPIATQVKPKSLVFAGGLSWYPNLDAMTFFLKSVWPELVQQVPDISLTVIGKNPPTWMLDMQKEYSNLHVTGFVDDVRPYLAEAQIYICPIKDGGGTKLKVLDALAMGKALVGDAIACEGIDVVNNKSVIFASTPIEYINKIKFLIDNPEIGEELASNGAQLIREHYSFQGIGKKMANVYSELSAQLEEKNIKNNK